MNEEYQFYFDGKYAFTLSIGDMFGLLGVIDPKNCWINRPVSVECGRFKIIKKEV